ncbi:hypothetical protein [Pandoraea sp. CB10b_02]|uniref:hypothetical protein n=1 Tax=Pandoraea sp. CB10b_02 TaxID=2014535 RepID=UPI00257B7320|nr:hypothetical protein [Pandoraea sp. CB10b_02]
MRDKRRWDGEIAVCIGSGPSLSKVDCDLIGTTSARTIAINSSWQMAPFADVIYAGDAAWWQAHISGISARGERWTCSRVAAREFGLHLHDASGPYSSGLRAIELAAQFGASRIVLIGFDCSVKGGSHWHGDHAKTKNPDARLCELWKKQFAGLRFDEVEIINASRQSELDCFPRLDLEQALVL